MVDPIAVYTGINDAPTAPTGLSGCNGSFLVAKINEMIAAYNNFAYQGVWDSASTYAPNDLVTYNGSTYRANAESTNKIPGTDPEWDLWAAAGADGDMGPAGADGADGASAYEVAVANGFPGTESEWLASLVGSPGSDGADGADGISFSWQGDWNPATSYVLNDAVQYGGSSWVANAPSLNKIPGTDPEWDLWVAKGDSGSANWGDIGGTLSNQSDLQAVLATKLSAVPFGGFIETIANKTYPLFTPDRSYLVKSLRVKSASGTCTWAVQINGVAVTGLSAVAVTSTEQLITATGGNTVTAGQRVAIVSSANSSAVGVEFTIMLEVA